MSTDRGNCSYCGTENQQFVEPRELQDLFELVISAYKTSSTGETLSALLSQDWAMFSESRISRDNVDRLLSDILNDSTIVRTLHIPTSKYESDSIFRWDRFRAELMHKNRFFPESDIDLDQLVSLLPHLLLAPDEIQEDWYRVRIQDGDTTIPPDKMGAPPESRAIHGRANPAGIPYLYLASSRTTAIAEVRPHTGELVTVADFHVDSSLKLIDLATPRQTVSPFALEDEGDIIQLRADIGFLEQLGDELSRPVIPNTAAVAYTPSQYLCEFIKKCGYDGVQYKSSVEDGVNLAIFNPDSALATTSRTHVIKRVSVDHESI